MISSVNVTKSAGNWICSHLLKKFLMENFIFCVVKITKAVNNKNDIFSQIFEETFNAISLRKTMTTCTNTILEYEKMFKLS